MNFQNIFCQLFKFNFHSNKAQKSHSNMSFTTIHFKCCEFYVHSIKSLNRNVFFLSNCKRFTYDEVRMKLKKEEVDREMLYR